MSRTNKGKSVARYLTGHSGIPNLSYDPSAQEVKAPYPYSLALTTDATAWRFFHYVKELDEKSISAVIRYDKYLESVDQAVVAMKLGGFATILGAHYETMHDRISQQERNT